MDTLKLLNREFAAQNFPDPAPGNPLPDSFRNIARVYASTENAIAVLSNLHDNSSQIYYGNFARTLGIDPSEKSGKVASIWEEEIFRLIHPDDLARKHLQELSFFQYIKRLPRKKRADYFLLSKLRMKTAANSYIPVLHRIFYISLLANEVQWLALCLYTPLTVDWPSDCLIVNSTNGHTEELGLRHHERILSPREKQILDLIDKGLSSKEIARALCISVNTVSRHRQEILRKLQAKNSIEACRFAKNLRLL